MDEKGSRPDFQFGKMEKVSYLEFKIFQEFAYPQMGQSIQE